MNHETSIWYASIKAQIDSWKPKAMSMSSDDPVSIHPQSLIPHGYGLGPLPNSLSCELQQALQAILKRAAQQADLLKAWEAL